MFNRLFVWLSCAAAASTFVGVVLASPGSGVLSSTVVARAAFQALVDIKLKVQDGKQTVLHVANAQETVMQQIVLAPGGQTGWHSHPGPAIALIKSGQLTVYAGEDSTCAGRTYSAGQAFVDSGQGHVHIARNLGSNNTELWVTYFDVPPGQPFRLDAPNPGTCGF